MRGGGRSGRPFRARSKTFGSRTAGNIAPSDDSCAARRCTQYRRVGVALMGELPIFGKLGVHSQAELREKVVDRAS